ncbi:NAD(P)-dependent oxidoreductase [Bacillus circulans]|uniref:NAD-dependent epimerase/dehydratase family protein n=1 Tax=Niallia circulans TaxID=1397 RepID=UPI0014903193|nr:NAD(P)-dependent oxidoreductase [Niallia circulans]NRG26241.1 NAD(P)-dependent oxidoreductase [Niallia circulans]QJX63266.1 NAD(P)-dependent oxidoreductase [Niallia circulans]
MVRVLIVGGQENKIRYALMQELSNKQIYHIVADQANDNSILTSLVHHQVHTFLNTMELAGLMAKYQIDCVIDLSNEPIISNKMKDSFEQSEKNIGRTIEVLEACVEAKVEKIIFPSTIAVYGDLEGVITEDMTLQPVLFEGLSKKIVEKYIQNYHTLYGLSYTILRFPILYGEYSFHNQNDNIVETTIKNVLENRPSNCFKDGEHKKHFLYISDAVRAFVSSLNKGGNEIFNICPMEKYSMKEVVSIIQSSIKEDSLPHKGLKEGEKSRISIKKAQVHLGWQAQVPFLKGIRLAIDNIKIGTKKEK